MSVKPVRGFGFIVRPMPLSMLSLSMLSLPGVGMSITLLCSSDGITKRSAPGCTDKLWYCLSTAESAVHSRRCLAVVLGVPCWTWVVQTCKRLHIN